jgi:hypothetical protein
MSEGPLVTDQTVITVATAATHRTRPTARLRSSKVIEAFLPL